ncbi:MAG: MarR family transcriptional regulator [Anaerolineales bacterium]|nr:MarR family transcriptional regulator [Anaerolineales bacterium]
MPTHYDGPECQTLALDTLIKLTRATNSLTARIARHNTFHDLTETQFGTLEALYHLGPMSQTEICGKLLKSGGNTTLVVDNLEKHGLVARHRDEHDRRVIMVDLTDDGRELISSIFPTHAAVVADEMSVLTPEEQLQLGALCKKLGKGQVCPTAATTTNTHASVRGSTPAD